jgi:single-stranded DNA-binding protein
MSLARVTLAGTLLHPPEKRFTQNNMAVSVLQLSVPVPPKRNAQAPSPDMVIKVLCWRNMADAVAALQPGTALHIEGRLQLGSIPAPEGGTPRKHFEVDAQRIYLLAGLPTALEVQANNNAGQPTSGQQSPMQQQGAPAQHYGQANALGAGAMAVTATPNVNLSDLTAEDFLTEDDIPF